MSTGPGAESEDRLLGWLRRQLGPGSLLGDDAAEVPPTAGSWAITVDSQVEGVHLPRGVDAGLLGRRLVAVTLSDLAASGARPAHGFLVIAAPPDFDHRRFFTGFLAACDEHGLRLSGGDLTRSPGGVVATLTALGTVAEGGFRRRRDARPGHHVWVGGTLGASALGQRLAARGAGLDGEGAARLPDALAQSLPAAVHPAAREAVRRHLAPRPQLELGAALGDLAAGAVMDLSDGLARDLPRLCRESGVGAEIDAGALPLAAGHGDLAAALEEAPLELALTGGEDYVLLFTLPPEMSPPAGTTCHRIGRTTAEEELWLRKEGRRQPWPAGGWDHLERSSGAAEKGNEIPDLP